MKTRIKIILIAVLTMFGFSANAQLHIVAVNGVEAFSKMTKEEVIAKFGEPTKYKYYDTEDNGINETYEYEETHFVFKDNSFIEFTICDNRFVVKLKDLGTGVTVGEKFSILEPLKPIYMDWFDKNWYCVYIYDEMVCFLVENGIIQCITFSVRL